jgi:Folylpolyglutamate synthase
LNADPAYRVISDIAKEKDAVLIRVMPEDIEVKEKGWNRTLFTFKEEEYEVSIPGGYQAFNASLAIEAVSKLDIYGQLLRCNVREGLRSVRWPCRMEKIEGLPIILDVTHTLAGAEVLVESIGEMYDEVILVFGLLDDKDIDGVSKNLSKIAKKVIVTSPDSDRALGKERVEETCRRYFDDVIMSESVSDAMDIAMRIRGEDMILVTGSFHMAGDAKKWLKRTYVGY